MSDPVRFEFDGEDTVTRGFNAVQRCGMIEMAVSFLKQKHKQDGYVGGVEVKNEGFHVYKLSINADGEVSRDS